MKNWSRFVDLCKRNFYQLMMLRKGITEYLLSSRKMASERQGNSVNVTQRDLLRPSIPSGTIVGFGESVMEVLLVDDED